MPIYEYRCDSCGHQFDAIQKLAEDPLRDCPQCEETALRKLLSAPSFRLKGTGWYETDFKDKNKKNGAADSDSAGKSASGDSATKSSGSKSDSGSKADSGTKADSSAKSGSSDSSSKSSTPAAAD